MVLLPPNKALSPLQRVSGATVAGRIKTLPGQLMLGADAAKEVSTGGNSDFLHNSPLRTTRNAAPGHNASLKHINA